MVNKKNKQKENNGVGSAPGGTGQSAGLAPQKPHSSRLDSSQRPSQDSLRELAE